MNDTRRLQCCWCWVVRKEGEHRRGAQEVYPGVRRGKREQAGRGAGEFLVYRRGKREEGRRVRVQGEVVGLIGCRGEERAVVYPAGKASVGGGWRRGGWTVAGQQVGGLAALGLSGGKRGGEIRYRVADMGRRRARRGEGEGGECAGKIGCEWCGVRGRCLPTFRLANLSVCWLVGLLGSRRLGELALHSGERRGSAG